MRHGWWLMALALAGCDGTGVPYTPTSGDLACADPTHEPVDGDMTILLLRVGLVDLYPIFVNGAQYETYGASSCRDPLTGLVSWVFESNGDPVGRLEMLATTTGNVDLQAEDQYFEIEVFGTTTATYGGTLTPAVQVTNQDFVSGAWVVDALTPELQATVQGETLSGGEYVVANLSVSAVTL